MMKFGSSKARIDEAEIGRLDDEALALLVGEPANEPTISVSVEGLSRQLNKWGTGDNLVLSA
jgi:hypothetical protein